MSQAHWSHDAQYPHRVHPGLSLDDMERAVQWCNRQWGHSDKRLTHKPGRMSLLRTNHRNGWFFFSGSFHFANKDHAMMFKLVHG